MYASVRSIFFSTSLLAGAAHAQVIVNDAWVRTAAPAQKAIGALMRLEAPADSQRVPASFPAVRVVEVPAAAMQSDVMRTRRVPFTALPARKAVDPEAGGGVQGLPDRKRRANSGKALRFRTRWSSHPRTGTAGQLQLPPWFIAWPEARLLSSMAVHTERTRT